MNFFGRIIRGSLHDAGVDTVHSHTTDDLCDCDCSDKPFLWSGCDIDIDLGVFRIRFEIIRYLFQKPTCKIFHTLEVERNRLAVNLVSFHVLLGLHQVVSCGLNELDLI